MNKTNEHEPASQIRRGEQPPLVVQIAREAADRIMYWQQHHGLSQDRSYLIIRDAIEKAHQSGWHEGRQYQVEYGTAAQPQRSENASAARRMERYGVMALVDTLSIDSIADRIVGSNLVHREERPRLVSMLKQILQSASGAASETAAVATSEPQEWTTQFVANTYASSGFDGIKAAHNAAIAAERENNENLKKNLNRTSDKLSAEREHRKLVDAVLALREHDKEVIERTLLKHRGQLNAEYMKNKPLATANLRLVELLERALERGILAPVTRAQLLASDIRAALARMKEQP